MWKHCELGETVVTMSKADGNGFSYWSFDGIDEVLRSGADPKLNYARAGRIRAAPSCNITCVHPPKSLVTLHR